jgi:hypothetical protein
MNTVGLVLLIRFFPFWLFSGKQGEWQPPQKMNDCSEKNPQLKNLQEKTAIRWQDD